MAAYLLAALALVSMALKAVRRSRKTLVALRKSRSHFWKEKRKPFRAGVFLEVVGCVIALVLADAFHRPSWAAPAVRLLIGLHFLPLGRIFETRDYDWVGRLIIASAVVAIARSGTWTPTVVAGIATGATLGLRPFLFSRGVCKRLQRSRRLEGLQPACNVGV